MKLVPLVLAAMLTVFPALAEEPAASIQAVIADQIGDFQRSDVGEAFAHAAPNIQGMFQTPERFGEMVRKSYPMVWRPASWQMRELVQTGSGPVQVVLFQDAQGRFHEAGYLMERIGGVWRIAGVKLREVPGVGT